MAVPVAETPMPWAGASASSGRPPMLLSARIVFQPVWVIAIVHRVAVRSSLSSVGANADHDQRRLAEVPSAPGTRSRSSSTWESLTGPLDSPVVRTLAAAWDDPHDWCLGITAELQRSSTRYSPDPGPLRWAPIATCRIIRSHETEPGLRRRTALVTPEIETVRPLRGNIGHTRRLSSASALPTGGSTTRSRLHDGDDAPHPRPSSLEPANDDPPDESSKRPADSCSSIPGRRPGQSHGRFRAASRGGAGRGLSRRGSPAPGTADSPAPRLGLAFLAALAGFPTAGPFHRTRALALRSGLGRHVARLRLGASAPADLTSRSNGPLRPQYVYPDPPPPTDDLAGRPPRSGRSGHQAS